MSTHPSVRYAVRRRGAAEVCSVHSGLAQRGATHRHPPRARRQLNTITALLHSTVYLFIFNIYLYDTKINYTDDKNQDNGSSDDDGAKAMSMMILVAESAWKQDGHILQQS